MAEPAAFRDRLSWDAAPGEIRDGPVRYMLIRPDALMAMFARLDADAAQAALAALGAAVTEHGARSAARYAGAAPLIEIVARTAPDLGWGRWTVGAGGALVEVRNSPFAAGIGTADRPARQPVCTPIAGMLRAVAGLMHGAPAMARETACAAVDGGDLCRFAIDAAAG